MHVTVLMSAYNSAATVAASLRSIQEQAYADWDLLVVDDGSTDDTYELLMALARTDERIHIIRNRGNLGLPASLNRGWREARGELIARMDADDISLPDRLERQVRFLSKAPDVAVLGTAAELVDENGCKLGCAVRPQQHEELASRIFREVPFIHPSVMVRRSFYEALGGYDERLRRSQDYDLWLRGYRRYRYHNLSEPLIRYRVRSRPSFSSIAWGTYCLGRAACRERASVIQFWYPLRFLLATSLTRLGLWSSRLK